MQVAAAGVGLVGSSCHCLADDSLHQLIRGSADDALADVHMPISADKNEGVKNIDNGGRLVVCSGFCWAGRIRCWHRRRISTADLGGSFWALPGHTAPQERERAIGFRFRPGEQ